MPLVLEKEISEPDLKKPRLSILQENGDLAFKVQANLNCDDDDPSKDKSKTRWFQVRFRLVASVPFDVLCRAMVVACVNTALKNSMIVKMIPFGRSPDAFFFKLDQQAQLRPKTMTDRYLNDSEEPIIGLRQSVRPALSENCLWLIAKPAMRRVYKEEKKNPPGPYKILEVKHRDTAVLAGVQIANLQQCVPVENREEIEKALMGRTFHVKYLRGSKWVEKVQKKGKPLEWIEKHKHFEKRNQKVWKVPNDSKETCIVWAADDPDLYRFEDQNGTRQTVYSYYQEQHGLRLQYPKMPIVRISKIEYFPVEYLNQGELRDVLYDITAPIS